MLKSIRHSPGARPGLSKNGWHCAVRSARMALALSQSNDDDVMKEVRLNSVDISERTAPAALSTAPTPGNMTVLQRSRRAIETALMPGAPPPPALTVWAG